MRIKNTFGTIKNFLKPGIFMFSIALLFLIIFIIFSIVPALEINKIVTWLVMLFENHGLVIVFFGALIESLFMLSMYLPGSLVMFLSVIVFGNNIHMLLIIWLLMIMALLVSNAFNYILGKFGYYRILLWLGGAKELQRTNDRFSKNVHRTMWGSAFHPNFLAIAMVSAGIAQYGIVRSLLLSIRASAVWLAVWITLAHLFFRNFDIAQSSNSVDIVFFVILVMWGLGVCCVEFLRNRNK